MPHGSTGPQAPKKIADIDWGAWTPHEIASECFVVKDDSILLIRKKRGLGAGKLVGPGGRMEAGENPHECAIREMQEELRVTPTGVVAWGEHDFHFTDGYTIRVFMFVAEDYVGEPTETEEAIPAWRPLAAIPYDEMWDDNRHWLPLMLRGVRLTGRYVVDGETLLDHELDHRFDPERALWRPHP